MPACFFLGFVDCPTARHAGEYLESKISPTRPTIFLIFAVEYPISIAVVRFQIGFQSSGIRNIRQRKRSDSSCPCHPSHGAFSGQNPDPANPEIP